MSQLNDEIPFRIPRNHTFKNEDASSKFPAASEVRARMCLNKILSSKDWAGFLDMTPQHLNALKNGEGILFEHQQKIFKIYDAFARGMTMDVHEIRKNAPNVNDWVAEELKIIEAELSNE